MSEYDSLYPYVDMCLRQTFGEPDRKRSKANVWTFQRGDGIPIHLMLNPDAFPIHVWLFDPHDENTPAMDFRLKSTADVDSFIAHIKFRMPDRRDKR